MGWREGSCSFDLYFFTALFYGEMLTVLNTVVWHITGTGKACVWRISR